MHEQVSEAVRRPLPLTNSLVMQMSVQFCGLLSKTGFDRAGKMAQWGRAMTALLVDPGGSLCNSSLGHPVPSPGLCGHQTCRWCTDMLAGKTLIHMT